MKKFYIIRHAESTWNAGEKITSVDSICLTEKGLVQAEDLAETLSVKPDLIVVSSYLRTQQTALPFIKKHPHVPIETWAVHEFTYLPPQSYVNTSQYEHIGSVFQYWHTKAVDWKASEESESFVEFTNRIKLFLEKLQSRPEKSIVIFSHSRFIKGLKLFLEKSESLGETSSPLKSFVNLNIFMPIPLMVFSRSQTQAFMK